MHEKFEWDESKNQLNIKKHKISFEEVILAFDDPMFFEKYDLKHSNEEDRYIGIGSVADVVIVTVSYTDRNGVTRIISARVATANERKEYYGKINDIIGS